MEPAQRFEIQLSHICNNRCVFCVSGQMTELRRTAPTPLENLITELNWAHEQGITKATIMGGEPTIHRTFWDVMNHAAALGFDDIFLFTNGSRLNSRKFIDRVLTIAKNITWRISIQGGNEEIHDATTLRKGAFKKIIAGLEYLTELGQPITINMCVVEQNYRSLLDLPALVARYNIHQVHLDMMRPKDAGERTEDYLDSIMPDYVDLGRVVDKTLSGFEEKTPELDVNIGNLPYCMAPQWGHRIHHGGAETYTVAAMGDGEITQPWNKYEDKKSDKVKRPECAECAFDHRCDGVFELYAQRRSLRAFQHVTVEALKALDPGQKCFTIQLHPAFEAVRHLEVNGWKLAEQEENELQRWVRLKFSHQSGAWVSFILRPAHAPGGGEGEHEDFVLRIDAAAHTDTVAVNAVTERVFTILAESLDGQILHSPSPARIQARRQVWGPMSTVPMKVQKRLKRLANTSGFGPWTIRATFPVLEPPGARVEFSGPNDDLALLDLRQSEEGRVQVSWQFPVAGREQSSRIELTERIVLALRSQTHQLDSLPEASITSL